MLVSSEPSPFRYYLEPREQYLYVRVEGKMLTVDEMKGYQAALEAGLTPEMGARVMVDGRDADRPLIELRAKMWTWMGETLRRAAIIANEERTKDRVARTAEMNRMVVKGFHSVEEAETWLLGELGA